MDSPARGNMSPSVAVRPQLGTNAGPQQPNRPGPSTSLSANSLRVSSDKGRQAMQASLPKTKSGRNNEASTLITGAGCECEVLKDMASSPSLQDHQGQSREQRGKKTSTGGEKYQPCRTFVYAPSKYQGGLPPGHDELPDARLELQHINGYRGGDCQDNLFHLLGGQCEYCGGRHNDHEVAFFTAAVGIVMNVGDGPNQRQQRYFHGHDDDIVSMAAHPSGHIVATGQVGRTPKICVWDTRTMQCLQTLVGFHMRFVACMTFSPDGGRLASIGGDDQHSCAVYNWESGSLVFNGKVHGAQVYTIKYNRHNEEGEFITVGEKHIKFWDGTMFKGQLGLMGNVGTTQNIYSIAYIDGERALTGCQDGDAYLWVGGSCVDKIVGAHNSTIAVHACEEGLVTAGSEGHVAVWESDKCWKCEAAGKIRVKNAMGYTDWAVCPMCFGRRRLLKDGTANRLASMTAKLDAAASGGRGQTQGRRWDIRAVGCGTDGKPTAAASIDCTCRLGVPCEGVMLLGTKTGEVITLNTRSGECTVHLRSHAGVVTGLAAPRAGKGTHTITAASDSTLRVWDITTRRMTHSLHVGSPAVCVAINPSASLYAVGHAGGRITVWDAEMLTESQDMHLLPRVDQWLPKRLSLTPPEVSSVASVTSGGSGLLSSIGVTGACALCKAVGCSRHAALRASMQVRVEDIQDIKFSPNGRIIAAASRDNFIDLYTREGDDVTFWRKTATCTGHSSYVTHVDFSANGELLQTTDGANELLYWMLPSGKQNPQTFDMRNVQWDTQTCVLGWGVKSVWPEGSDGTDINALSVTTTRDLVVTADDFGHVKLFRYPCAGDKARFRAYVCHSSHVPAVTFANGDQHVVSCGGSDQTMAVFNLARQSPPPPMSPMSAPAPASPTVEPTQEGVEPPARSDPVEQAAFEQDCDTVAALLDDAAAIAGKHPELTVVADALGAILAALHGD